MNKKAASCARIWFWVPLLFAFTIPLTSGCGNRSKYELAPVSGVVTLDGEPLVGAVVNFQPMASGEDPQVGAGSNARTDEQGRFVLNTIDDHEGASVGRHRVRIYSFSPESPRSEDTGEDSSEERVPHRYNYRSKLIFDVPAEGTKEANFELELP